MSKLEYYKDLQEKSKKFKHFKIDTKEDFDELYRKLKSENSEQIENSLIYRGSNNSAFKLYSSSQRHWIQKELGNWKGGYHFYIQNLIDNAKAWQNNLLVKFYKSFGHNTAYEIAVLSFLQHYASPSPLIDWTYSLDNSLFFAFDKMEHPESDQIGNYCSVYILNKTQSELMNYIDVYQSGKYNFEELKAKHPDVDSKDLDKQYNEYSYSLIKDLPLVYISDTENNGNPTMYTNTNFNIINQEGLFIYNNSPTEPLENIFKGKENVQIGDTFHLDKITCIDIHKNLAEHIKDLLISEGISNKFIYPQEEDLAWDSFTKYLK